MTRTSSYASVLSKIGAERGKFLSEAQLKALAENSSLSQFASQLRGTNYGESVAEISLPLTSRKLERVFQETLIGADKKIVTYSPKNIQKFLKLYLLKFEIENVKTLVKSVHAKLTIQQKLARIYFSVEDFLGNRGLIEDAAKAATLKQLVESLKKTEYSTALNVGLTIYEETGSTVCFDVFLDKVFYEKLRDAYRALPRREKPHAVFYVSAENDGYTLLTLLRGKNLNYDSNWLRLAVAECNVNVSKHTVEELLLAPNFESSLNIALKSSYGTFFANAPTPEEAIARAERSFRKTVFEYARGCKIFELFNVGAPLAFMVQKSAEIFNLAALSLGIEAGLKPETIGTQLLI